MLHASNPAHFQVPNICLGPIEAATSSNGYNIWHHHRTQDSSIQTRASIIASLKATPPSSVKAVITVVVVSGFLLLPLLVTTTSVWGETTVAETPPPSGTLCHLLLQSHTATLTLLGQQETKQVICLIEHTSFLGPLNRRSIEMDEFKRKDLCSFLNFVNKSMRWICYDSLGSYGWAE